LIAVAGLIVRVHLLIADAYQLAFASESLFFCFPKRKVTKRKGDTQKCFPTRQSGPPPHLSEATAHAFNKSQSFDFSTTNQGD
jgi:hypothetical protein